MSTTRTIIQLFFDSWNNQDRDPITRYVHSECRETALQWREKGHRREAIVCLKADFGAVVYERGYRIFCFAEDEATARIKLLAEVRDRKQTEMDACPAWCENERRSAEKERDRIIAEAPANCERKKADIASNYAIRIAACQRNIEIAMKALEAATN